MPIMRSVAGTTYKKGRKPLLSSVMTLPQHYCNNKGIALAKVAITFAGGWSETGDK